MSSTITVFSYFVLPVEEEEDGGYCHNFNPLHAKLFIGNIKINTIYIILPHWSDPGSWNPSSCKTRTYPFCIVKIMGADAVVKQGARASATMILTMLNCNIFGPRMLKVNQILAICLPFSWQHFKCFLLKKILVHVVWFKFPCSLFLRV